MRNRRWICLLLAVLTLLACTACVVKTNDGASGDVRTLTDSKNRTVEVPKQVERVVCVGVGALRYSCYVGAADRVVGVEDYETKAGMSRLYNYVNFDKFKDLPVTGTNGEPYVEQIIDVAPQVIVMSAYASCDADELRAGNARARADQVPQGHPDRPRHAHGQDCRRSEAVRLCRRRVLQGAARL